MNIPKLRPRSLASLAALPVVLAELLPFAPQSSRGQLAGKDPLPSGSTWTLAAVGDAIMTRQVAHFESDPAFMALVKEVRAADAAAINLEINLFRLRAAIPRNPGHL